MFWTKKKKKKKEKKNKKRKDITQTHGFWNQLLNKRFYLLNMYLLMYVCVCSYIIHTYKCVCERDGGYEHMVDFVWMPKTYRLGKLPLMLHSNVDNAGQFQMSTVQIEFGAPLEIRRAHRMAQSRRHSSRWDLKNIQNRIGMKSREIYILQ